MINVLKAPDHTSRGSIPAKATQVAIQPFGSFSK